MSVTIRRVAALVNVVLAGCVLAIGTVAVILSLFLAWVWVGFGTALTVLALLWVQLRRWER